MLPDRRLYSGTTMLAHGILRTATTFASRSSCVAFVPSSRWIYETSVLTSVPPSRRVAALRRFSSDTATFDFDFASPAATFVRMIISYPFSEPSRGRFVFPGTRFPDLDGLAADLF